ncbi:hypothetical protein NITGR_500007 [Nitrospina gracilis 3/211]|uniref:Uncharacterized protein n=1 Tax=Nitrospina gracilis (strain 3/211) TaxID=1266370 RepID=M1YKD2_NITG3|nr:hypothetical protein NITGR_500007 [Nitrospina gracilis 3/211]
MQYLRKTYLHEKRFSLVHSYYLG